MAAWLIPALKAIVLHVGSIIEAATERPSYHPAVLLKIDIYDYFNRIPSSRRLEREASRM